MAKELVFKIYSQISDTLKERLDDMGLEVEYMSVDELLGEIEYYIDLLEGGGTWFHDSESPEWIEKELQKHKRILNKYSPKRRVK